MHHLAKLDDTVMKPSRLRRIRDKMKLWYCKRCRCNRKAQLTTKGKERVATLRSGFVAVFLSCGHAVAVRQDRVK